MTERPPVLYSARYERAPKIGQRWGLTERYCQPVPQTPGPRVEDRTNLFKTERIACTNGNSPAPRPGETRQLFLTYTLVLERILL
jgi:hypothetical protein